MGLYQTDKLLHRKKQTKKTPKKPNEKAPHIMEATFFKTSVGLGVNIQSIKTSIDLKQQKCL